MVVVAEVVFTDMLALVAVAVVAMAAVVVGVVVVEEAAEWWRCVWPGVA